MPNSLEFRPCRYKRCLGGLPGAKGVQQPFTHRKRDRVLVEPAEESDRLPHLIEIVGAALAAGQMLVQAPARRGRQLVLEIVGDDLDEFFAGQLAHGHDVLEVLLERPPQLRASAVKQHSLIGPGKLEDVTEPSELQPSA
jgi:hypothetical protein